MAANERERALDVLAALNEAPGHPKITGGRTRGLVDDLGVHARGQAS